MAFSIMLFCFFLLLSLGYLPEIPDSKVNQNIVDSCFWLLAIIFLLYGGYSTAQDVAAIIIARSGRPYAAQANTTETTVTTTTTTPPAPQGGAPIAVTVENVEPIAVENVNQEPKS